MRTARALLVVCLTAFDASGSAQTITEFPLAAGAAPIDIVAGPDGALWFTEQHGHKIGRMTPQGAIAEFATPTPQSFPTGITVGLDGAVWFTGKLIGTRSAASRSRGK